MPQLSALYLEHSALEDVDFFARNEFQVVQLIPLVLATQIFLSGIFLPVEQIPRFLEAIARVLPLTYAVQELWEIMLDGKRLSEVAP